MFLKSTVDNTQTPLPSQPQPLHLLHPPTSRHPLTLLFTARHQQLPDHTRILPNAVSLKSLQQINGLNLLIRIRGRKTGHEDRENGFAAFEVAGGEDAAAEGEDVGDPGAGVVIDVLLVGERDQALAWEHGGAEVDYGGLEEEEGLYGLDLLLGRQMRNRTYMLKDGTAARRQIASSLRHVTLQEFRVHMVPDVEELCLQLRDSGLPSTI